MLQDMREFAGKKVLLVEENSSVPHDPRVWHEARALKNAGADVYVICPIFRNNNATYEIIEGIRITRYRVAFSNGTALGYLREYAVSFLRTIYLVNKTLRREGHIDVLHAANPPDIFWPLALYLRVFNVRFIFDEHDLSPETYLSRFGKAAGGGGMMFRVLKLLQRLSYRFADAIISTNESYRANAIAQNPAYALKTFVVRNGPDTRFFSLRPAIPTLKKGRRYLAAYMGVMAYQDGVEYLLRAVDHLVNRKGFRDFIVYLIGTGDDWERLRSISSSLNLQDYITFTGYLPDEEMLEILSTADICLSPDPFSPLNDRSTMNKVMDYMALGKPIVSFDLKEARVSAGESAMYVENNNVEAFADAIITLLEDPERSVTMGRIGKQRVQDDLCWQRQTKNLLNAYRYVFDNQPGTSPGTRA